MMLLMKQEIKKFGLMKYIIFSTAGIFVSMFFMFVGLNDSSTSIYDYDVTFRMISLIFCFYYIILFAILVVTYVVNEYTNKTILVMFSYPIDRRKLILAKLLLITALVVISMILGYICCSIFIVVVDKCLNLVAGDFHISILSYWIPTAMKSIIMFSSLGMCTFVVGMIKKSVPMTIVSAFVFSYIRQFILAGANITEEGWLLVICVAAIAIAGVYYTLTYKVKQIS